MDSSKPAAKIDGRSSPERRAQVAAANAITKRKYPREYDTRSRLYTIWRAMIFRCEHPSHEAFSRYGGRGIGICEEWRKDYAAFVSWSVNAGYAASLTIDRIDNHKGYSPDNCRWVPMSKQNRNKRNSSWLTAFGETKLIIEWIEDPRCQVSRSPLERRLARGIKPEMALTMKPRRVGMGGAA